MPRVTQPRLYPKQANALFDPARYSIIEASTKAGKTLGAIVWQSTGAMQDTTRRNHWWVAPVYNQAEIAFNRACRMYGQLVGADNIHKSKLTITFPGAGVWHFKSAEKPDNLYGEDVVTLVFDEFTRAREEAWHALRSTLTATRGRARFIGNVKGRAWGYHLARRAEAGEPDHAYHRITAADAIEAGILDASEIAQAERDLPHAVFRELYFCEPADNAGNPFGYQNIAACVGELSAAPPAVFGVDLGRARDYTVVIGLDASGNVCHLDRWQGIPWMATINRIAETIGIVPTLIDQTGLGDPITERLQHTQPQVEGYVFTAPSKQALMENLAVGLSRREVTYPDGPVRIELDAFEYQYTRTGTRYSAPVGMHDDCVCALALAAWHLAHRPRDAMVESAIIRAYEYDPFGD